MPEVFGTSFFLDPAEGSTEHEIMRNNHYSLDILGIDSRLAVQDTTVPRIELEQVEVYHYNDRIKLASKPNPSDLTVDVLDFVEPQVIDQLWQWFKEIYDPGTRNMGYANAYKRVGKLFLWDPTGVQIRVWTLKGLFPLNAPVPSGAYSYEGGQNIVKVDMKFSCDVATLDDASAA